MYNWLQMHTSTVNCSNLSFHVVRMKLHIIWTFGFWMNLQIYDSIAKHTGTTFNMLQNKKGTADKHCHNNKSKILVKTGYAYGQTHTNTHISSRYSTPSGGGVKKQVCYKKWQLNLVVRSRWFIIDAVNSSSSSCRRSSSSSGRSRNRSSCSHCSSRNHRVRCHGWHSWGNGSNCIWSFL